jgi:hypothetical protein
MTQTNTIVAKDKRETTRSKSSKPAKAAAPKLNKSANVIELLSRPEGVTIEAISKATNWQAHSVRGFLAGTVKKKLGKTLTSEKTESGRIYRIVEPTGA